MDRLTIKFPNGYLLQEPKTEDGALAYINAIAEKLGKLEDAEEQGLLLQLPCKVGTKVYHIHTLPRTNRKVIGAVDADAFFLTLCILENRFGNSVFLAKEDAIKKLAELNSKTDC